MTIYADAGRLGAYTRWSQATAEERQAQGRRGQQGLREKLLRAVEVQEGPLPEPERTRRGDLLMKAHYARMALARRQARMRRNGPRLAAVPGLERSA